MAKAQTQDLPGMEDRSIRAIEDVAAEISDLKARKQLLRDEEQILIAKLLRLMHKHGKHTYRRDGIEISIVPSAESVKVKITKAERDEAPEGEEIGEEAQA